MKLKNVTAKMVLTKIIVTPKGGQIEGGKLKFKAEENKKLLGWILGEAKLTMAIDGVEAVTSISKLIFDADGAELKNPCFKFSAQQYERLIKLVQSGAEVDIVIEQVQGELPLGDPNEKTNPADDLFMDEEAEKKRRDEKAAKLADMTGGGVASRNMDLLRQDNKTNKEKDRKEGQKGLIKKPKTAKKKKSKTKKKSKARKVS